MQIAPISPRSGLLLESVFRNSISEGERVISWKIVQNSGKDIWSLLLGTWRSVIVLATSNIYSKPEGIFEYTQRLLLYSLKPFSNWLNEWGLICLKAFLVKKYKIKTCKFPCFDKYIECFFWKKQYIKCHEIIVNQMSQHFNNFTSFYLSVLFTQCGFIWLSEKARKKVK